MVTVAIAGGSGNVAPEIIDAILASKKHNVIILSRKESRNGDIQHVKQLQVDYQDKNSLVGALRGVDVVLSFILPFADANNSAQKTLIDASVEAGVKRFAPSEWAVSSNSQNPFYSMRDEVRAYLEHINREKFVLEYTCFQPGLFLNYFTYPQQSTKHLKITEHYVDFATQQAILVGDGEQPVTFTLIEDLAAVVCQALDHPAPWPAIGGVQGWQTTSAELVRLGERLTGKPFKIHRVSREDLEKGQLATDWVPLLEHPAIPKDKLVQISRAATLEAMKGIPVGAWATSNEWNLLLPDYKFADPEEFLKSWWSNKV